MNTVVELEQATSDNAGPKMGRLGELIRRGIEVPAGFVVTSMPREREGDGIGADLDNDIRAAYRLLCGDVDKPVVVRSSAADEDGSGASFAGVFDSYLGVLGAEQVVAAVHDCRAGLHSARAVAYRERLGRSEPTASMAVGVMRMVPARASGVAFTVDPVSGRDDRMLIEASFGFGEPVVQGVVTPDRIEVADDGRILRYVTSHKRIALQYNDTGGMKHVELTPIQARTPALSPAETTALSERVRAVMAIAGQPVDCEWVIDDTGAVWIVQWRPVTAVQAGEALRWDPAKYAARYAFRSG